MRSLRILLAAVLSVAFAACNGPDEAATGREIYAEVCARCHAADLSGAVGPALGPGSNAASQPDEYILTTISDGRGRMPSFRQTLSDSQIERVARYLRSEQGSG